MKWMQRNIVALVVAVALAVGFAGPAVAQNQGQNGLVNVAIGNVVIQDINIGIAAQIIANVCDLTVQAAVAVVAGVAQGAPSTTVCSVAGTPIVVSQD